MIKFLIMLLIMLGSCKIDSEKKYNKITLPEDKGILIHKPNNSNLTHLKPKYYFIHYFTADCSVCLAELSWWNNYFSKVNTENINIIFVASSDDLEITKYVISNLELDYGVHFDNSFTFFRINNMPIQNYTALLDENFNILCEGSLFDQRAKLEPVYMKYLTYKICVD